MASVQATSRRRRRTAPLDPSHTQVNILLHGGSRVLPSSNISGVLDAEVTSHHSTTQEQRSSTVPQPLVREPIGLDGVESGDPSDGNFLEQAQDGNREARDPIAVILSRVKFNVDQPMEHLPVLHSPVLHYIGQIASLSIVTRVNGANRRMHYTGLLCTVTKRTVVLVHAFRYTEADFKARCHCEVGTPSTMDDQSCTRVIQSSALFSASACPLGLLLPRAGNGVNGMSTVSVFPSQQHPNASRDTLRRNIEDAGAVPHVGTHHQETAAAVSHEPFGASTDSQRSCSASHSGAGPALSPRGASTPTLSPPRMDSRYGQFVSPRVHTHPHRRNRMMECDGSIGPLPYVSFLLKDVRGLSFVQETASNFHALLQTKPEHCTEMQYLRMFVRRYLAHASQGANPTHVPLRVYLSTRCGYVSPDAQLLDRVAKEELENLLRTDREMYREKISTQRTRSRASENGNEPSGLFARTGELFYTGLPQRTFQVCVLLFILLAFYGLYYAVALGVLSDAVISEMMTRNIVLNIVTLFVSTSGACATVVHALIMRAPLRSNIALLVVRLFTGVGSMVCGLLNGIDLFLMLGEHGSIQTISRYVDVATLCDYYLQKGCSGYTLSCTDIFWDDPVCPCALPAAFPKRSCQAVIEQNARSTCIPLIAFSFSIVAMFGYLQYLLFAAACTAERRSVSNTGRTRARLVPE